MYFSSNRSSCVYGNGAAISVSSADTTFTFPRTCAWCSLLVRNLFFCFNRHLNCLDVGNMENQRLLQYHFISYFVHAPVSESGLCVSVLNLNTGKLGLSQTSQ